MSNINVEFSLYYYANQCDRCLVRVSWWKWVII